tara:strand:- start:614 stop:817 length:204 start_codon:yes stop_codon:yes gene_type:complete
VLNNVICWHLAFHFRVSQILYERMTDLYDLEKTSHRLLLIFLEEESLEKASKGVWTQLKNELKVAKL